MLRSSSNLVLTGRKQNILLLSSDYNLAQEGIMIPYWVEKLCGRSSTSTSDFAP